MTGNVIVVDVHRDFNGIAKLPLMQLISPYKLSHIRGSLEIPLLSLDVPLCQGRCAPRHVWEPGNTAHREWMSKMSGKIIPWNFSITLS